MEITIIAALDENNVIGFNNDLPWKPIPGDLPRFKRLTIPHPVIMGRNTYESIYKRLNGPLMQRDNIVLSSPHTLPSPLPKNVYPAKDWRQAHAIAADIDNEAYVIGGAKVFETALPYANRLELTHVHGKYHGDTFFPKINPDEWIETNREVYDTHDFATYIKKL